MLTHINEIEKKENIDMLIKAIPVPLLKISEEGQILEYNIAFKNLLNLSEEDIISLNFFNNNYRVVESKKVNLLELQKEESFVLESIWRGGNKGVLYIQENFTYLKKHKCFLIFLENITDKKKLLRSLEITEEKFRFLIDQVPVGMYRIIATGEIVFANEYLAKILGYKDRESIEGKIAEEILHFSEDFNNILQTHIKKKDTNFSFEYLFTTSEGKELWLEITAHIFYDTSEEMLFYDGIIKDITEKKQIENHIKRLLTAINHISEAIVITDNSGKIIYANPALEKMTGYSITELHGKKMNIFRSGIHSNEFYSNLWKSILSGINWEGTIINKRKNGELFTEYMVITPVKNNDGQIVNFVAVKRDMSEVLKLEEKIKHSQKLQAIGTLAGGIAHDFNNILMGMQIFTEVLLKKLPPESYEYDLGIKILESQNRAKELIQQILTFSRPGTEDKAPLTIHVVVKETLKLIKNTFPASINIQEDIDDCGTILANPSHIHQLVMNLCTNANDAMRGHGTLTVQLKRKTHITYPNKSIHTTGHDWICLCVKDTGCGIEEKIRSRIFDPFFTTKQVGEGTGLGLSIVHGIVKNYGGEIFFNTRIGKGTDFYIYLPVR